MRFRSIAVVGAVVLALAACDSGDAELSTDSTIITGGTNAPAATTTTTPSDGGTSGSSPSTTLVGEPVAAYDVVQRTPNDNGEAVIVVIPEGAYTDVDLENFVIDLLESDENIYGAEVFGDETAVEAFLIDPASLTEEQTALIERYHYVTVVGRDRIEYRGPFAEFPGGAIGS
ncbi:MAG TPA: hypothetical protein VFS66_01295 [Acidimicrobiia bacterium]|nr:hypothetical protein [Acidimicrobiia bacterium]